MATFSVLVPDRRTLKRRGGDPRPLGREAVCDWAGAQQGDHGGLHVWFTAQLAQVSGKSGLAEAMRYALRHWQGLLP
jgi:hypothetical protein